MKKVNFQKQYAYFNITNPDDHIQKCWTHDRFYETGRSQLLTWCYNNLPVEMNILDIGANLGNHSIFFSKIMKAKVVYAIEPYWPNFEQLVENILLNSCDNIYPLNIAAYSSIGVKRVQLKNVNNSGMVEISDKGQPVICTLADFIVADKIDYIKIDVEGCELNAIGGCLDTINEHQPVISVETNEPDKVSRVLPNYYHRIPITLNHTPTHVWKKL